jgi:serine/threonine protein kinase
MITGVGICPKCLEEFEGGVDVCPNDGSVLIRTGNKDDPRIGQTIDDKFTIVDRLGTGGMGSVYRAVQHSMDREVALKLLHPRFSTDKTIVRRFLQEARAASGLTHPNTITLFDFGQTSTGELYIIMELLSGRTLAEVIASENGFSPVRAVAIIGQVCDALHSAHEAKLVHRDLKPDNIFIIRGAGQHGEFVKVLDFGIAKSLTATPAETPLTLAGVVCGTPMYMSPEQAAGRPVDRRADIYSAGIVLYEMLAGRPPFLEETASALLMAHLQTTPQLLRTLKPGTPVSPELEAVVMRALAKKPAGRPATALEFKQMIRKSMCFGEATGELSELEVGETLHSMATPIPPTLEGVPRPVPLPPEQGGLELNDTRHSKPTDRGNGAARSPVLTDAQLPLPSKDMRVGGSERQTSPQVEPGQSGKRGPGAYYLGALGLVVGTILAVVFLGNQPRSGTPLNDGKKPGSETSAPVARGLDRPSPATPPAATTAKKSQPVSAPVKPLKKVVSAAPPKPKPPVVEKADVTPSGSEKKDEAASLKTKDKVAPVVSAASVQTMEVAVKPKTATVKIGGTVQLNRPVTIVRPEKGSSITIEISKKGYRRVRKQITWDTVSPLEITLRRVRKRKGLTLVK